MTANERIAFSRCVNNERLFALNRIFEAQSDATFACENEFQSTLGPIRSASEFNEIIDAIRITHPLLVESDPLENVDFLIGLEAMDGQGPGGGNTSVFSFIDGLDTLGLDFFHGSPGIFPWDSPSQPNNVEGGQNCGAARFATSNLFSGLVNDLNCDFVFDGAICRSACSYSEIDMLINDSLFKLVLENESQGSVTADQAIERCSFVTDDSNDPMMLGPIRGEDEFNQIIQQLSNSEIFLEALESLSSLSIALDLRVPVDSREAVVPDDPTDFLFLDEDVNSEGLDFFHGNIGEFPWREGQPNNFGFNQFCVHLLAEKDSTTDDEINFLLSDEDCETELAHAFLCRAQEIDIEDGNDNNFFFLGAGCLLFFAVQVCLLLFLLKSLRESNYKLRELQKELEVLSQQETNSEVSA